jgi:hypothetical protein
VSQSPNARRDQYVICCLQLFVVMEMCCRDACGCAIAGHFGGHSRTAPLPYRRGSGGGRLGSIVQNGGEITEDNRRWTMTGKITTSSQSCVALGHLAPFKRHTEGRPNRVVGVLSKDMMKRLSGFVFVWAY